MAMHAGNFNVGVCMSVSLVLSYRDYAVGVMVLLVFKVIKLVL